MSQDMPGSQETHKHGGYGMPPETMPAAAVRSITCCSACSWARR
ncbi:hypothetical protein [Embleya hyalina]|uniref:Uncharacterized protein n=1 Tax=Embleya hyalina TaxID=516124 RepID=A0A401YXD6_9ACTN|nr:hypothetical protein [Embleya hyalina]GCD99259.1 hypothetical protein EHYA_06973 [Embleya hyalina]